MTTIIVIVIGVTLLSLGLVWVRSTFGNIKELTDRAFENAQQEITITNRDPRLTVPLQIAVKRGPNGKAFSTYLTNDGSTESNDFNMRIDAESNSGIRLKMLGTPEDGVKTLSIPEGEEREIRVVVVAGNNVNIGSYSYNILVNDGNYDEKGFIVIVEK